MEKNNQQDHEFQHSKATANESIEHDSQQVRIQPPVFQLQAQGVQPSEQSVEKSEKQILASNQHQYSAAGIFPSDDAPSQLKPIDTGTDKPPFQLEAKENNTGLPDQLKSGIENLSGFSMDDVNVNYNSDKPAQLNAHAYAQGTDIHVASGQEKHLPHEAWHVVQQKQGRVNATRQMKGKLAINDDVGLEQEADMMGAKAMQLRSYGSEEQANNNTVKLKNIALQAKTIQRAVAYGVDFQKNHEVDALNVNTAVSNFRNRGSDINSVVKKTDVEKSSNFAKNNLITPSKPEYDFAAEPDIDVIKAVKKGTDKIKLTKHKGPMVEGRTEGTVKKVTHLGSSGVFKEHLGTQDLIDPQIAIDAAAKAKATKAKEAEAASAAETEANVSKKLEFLFTPHKKKTQARKDLMSKLIKPKAAEVEASVNAQKNKVTVTFKAEGQALSLYKEVEALLKEITFECTVELTNFKIKYIKP